MRKGTGGFKNIKLGKNVYRQLKRKGTPIRPSVGNCQPDQSRSEKRPKK
jgi:hypothetical protein